MKEEQFDWVIFYKAFARRLLEYKDNRRELIVIIRKIYENIGLSLPTLGKDGYIEEVDPFTVFGLFNKQPMKESNRKKIVSEIGKLFGIDAPTPTSFASIPVLNALNAIFFYYQSEQAEQEVDNLWGLFESALAYADSATSKLRDKVSHHFSQALNIKGTASSKITMGLYWIAPDAFLSLDSRNKWFIFESGEIPEDFVKSLPRFESKITAQKYFEIVEKTLDYLRSGASDLKDFKELSYKAWQLSKDSKDGEEPVKKVRYWVYAPGDNACKWDEFFDKGIMGIGWEELGDLKQYHSKTEIKEKMKESFGSDSSHANSALATWQFANELKPGDVVFAKKGTGLIVGRGVVTSDYEYDPSRPDYNNIRKVDWTNHDARPFSEKLALKTLTNVTPYTEYVEKLERLFNPTIIDPPHPSFPPYDSVDFLNDVFMDEERYETLKTLLLNKKNVILQGAPGVGKTYAAKRLAYSIIGAKDQSRVTVIQFHQSYSYEDFIMGYRPTEHGFELRQGVFYQFCKEAEQDDENDYFFIIDEINRGNLSKIFGELFMLLEKDKRGVELRLLYSNEKFRIPKNVHLIGMMNTADRSLAMLDYALRRRFAFFEMRPAFDSDGFGEYQERLDSEKFNRLIDCVEDLNDAISADDALGEGFCVGHSYFCDLEDATDDALSRIVEFEIVPLLKEYWFDEPDMVKSWSAKLRDAIK